MKALLKDLLNSVLLTLVLVVIVCGAYPLAVWAIAQVCFPYQANGSLVVDKDGTVRGSALLAQNFDRAEYFQPRPSAAGTGYDATNSDGTNYGPTSSKLALGSHAKDAKGNAIYDPGNFDGIKDLVADYRAINGLKDTDPVPADAVTRSGSGLDPHISLANARLQAPRVAQARHLPLDQVQTLIAKYVQGRDLGVFGEPGVNVLLLNRALDQVAPVGPAKTGS
jgi:K+-transporting ATPase ATPase C chain